MSERALAPVGKGPGPQLLGLKGPGQGAGPPHASTPSLGSPQMPSPGWGSTWEAASCVVMSVGRARGSQRHRRADSGRFSPQPLARLLPSCPYPSCRDGHKQCRCGGSWGGCARGGCGCARGGCFPGRGRAAGGGQRPSRASPRGAWQFKLSVRPARGGTQPPSGSVPPRQLKLRCACCSAVSAVSAVFQPFLCLSRWAKLLVSPAILLGTSPALRWLRLERATAACRRRRRSPSHVMSCPVTWKI